MKKKRYIIYSPKFDEKSGGVIALHALCHYLNENGHNSKVFFKRDLKHNTKQFMCFVFFHFFCIKSKYFCSLISLKQSFIKNLEASRFHSLKNLKVNYTGKIKKNDIVVYPEIVDGNPLNGSNVVRWFLHQPGYFTGRINYGKNELYFFFQEYFNNTKINPYNGNLLRIILPRTDIFYNKNYPNRKGSCYCIRKGKGKEIIHDLKNSILIDNLSQEEISETFNRKEFFYSYDTKTAYSEFAAICGCKSIIIPDQGVSKQEWGSEKELTYGIAYGIDDLEYAEKTKHLLFEKYNNMNKNNTEMLNKFVCKCDEFFNRI